MRLIDADAFFKDLELAPDDWAKGRTVKAFLDETPTVDAEPVRHGEWDVTVCTRCGHDLSGWADGAYEAVADGDVHYCPSCGAKMNGGET